MGQKLTVGQTLWHVPGDSRYANRAREVTVTKVGRKWAEIGPYTRVDMETMLVDSGGHGYSDRCYLSREHWEAEQRLSAAWQIARKAINAYGKRPPASLAAIASALDLMGYFDQAQEVRALETTDA